MPVLDRIAEREFFDAPALHAVRSVRGPLSEAVESLRRDNRDMVREAIQAAQGLKEQAVVLGRTRIRQMMDEITQRPAFEPAPENLRL